MQENRSFNHYFGTLGGVRGFNDKATLPTDGQQSIFHQKNGTTGAFILPFHADSETTRSLSMTGLAHAWPDAHQMWNNGRWDNWVAAKGTKTMVHFTRNDLPFHFQLADSFTVCDQYFSSALGATNTNRMHLFTGMLDIGSTGNGPLLDNKPVNGIPLLWTTYVERLQNAGVSWNVYQGSVGDGSEPFKTALTPTVMGDLDFPNNYNAMRFFQNIFDAPADSPLANVLAKRTYAQLVADVQSNQLAQVSWLMPPALCSEHPVYTPADGATYIAAVLDALTSNPAVWAKTVFFIMYDENDGFFDHCVAPVPPVTNADGLSNIDTTNELFVSSPNYPTFVPGPVGMGARVPMFVISPWSKGAWTCSEVFDHTSVIRFLEKRFGVHEPNITTWRRAIAGDLTSAFDFSNPNTSPVSVPSAEGLSALADSEAGLATVNPPTIQSMPVQEAGVRQLRAAPYELFADATVISNANIIQLKLINTGKTAVVFHVYSGIAPTSVKRYTVDVNTSITDTWTWAPTSGVSHDLTVVAPNGFLRRFAGGGLGVTQQEVTACYEVTQGDIELNLTNASAQPCTFTISDNSYGQAAQTLTVASGQTSQKLVTLAASSSWYDLIVTSSLDPSFVRRFAGHVETGKPGMSDPTLSFHA